ncbi:hypothetical protein CAOG_03726 [Capsaspora owczarzaki ATCC 30864]|uniref:Autophagy-related protein 11 C-terminal domain-containing protein n=1 Tax=Capsaspora owczarzaki (strain ATCC 30864) TaxID=595528 RepID=A0A0D2WPW0_CAPO3|nr:hypothetical protein CAOG_03726 [Capsaspora owczarzaki ATCC 30864]KJE92828.1 hypothetical protein CAOG_003726 [Capsaspora owczarzaki ATCC 30864]|eukprot:XP_004363454.1 hypothetical protein CAOG_03726 [Capsaspora owczarzaki ATCC 30864]
MSVTGGCSDEWCVVTERNAPEDAVQPQTKVQQQPTHAQPLRGKDDHERNGRDADELEQEPVAMEDDEEAILIYLPGEARRRNTTGGAADDGDDDDDDDDDNGDDDDGDDGVETDPTISASVVLSASAATPLMTEKAARSNTGVTSRSVVVGSLAAAAGIAALQASTLTTAEAAPALQKGAPSAASILGANADSPRNSSANNANNASSSSVAAATAKAVANAAALNAADKAASVAAATIERLTAERDDYCRRYENASRLLSVITNELSDRENERRTLTPAQLIHSWVASQRQKPTFDVDSADCVGRLTAATIDMIRDRNELLRRTIETAQRNDDNRPRLAFSNLTVGDLVVFFPTTHGHYIAFSQQPRYYLSQESIKAFDGSRTSGSRRDYLLGEIIQISEHVADDSSPDGNPYKLPANVRYHTIIAALASSAS